MTRCGDAIKARWTHTHGAIDHRLENRGLNFRQRALFWHGLDQLKEQVIAVLPITFLLVFVIGAFFQQPTNNPAEQAYGLVCAIFGLLFFMEGLRVVVMPLGEMVGSRLPLRWPLPVVLLVAGCLGILVTYAEPAIASLSPLAKLVDPTKAPYLYFALNEQREMLVLSIGLGVGLAAVVGTLRFVQSWSIKPLIYISLAPTIALACYMQWGNPDLAPLLGLAWDCGAVTTGPVTVPILLAVGIGVMTSQRQKRLAKAALQNAVDTNTGQTLEGFGVVTLASVFPVLAVEIMGIMLSVTYTKEEIIANANTSESTSAIDKSPTREIIFAVRAIAPLVTFLLLIIVFLVREPLPHLTVYTVKNDGGHDDSAHGSIATDSVAHAVTHGSVASGSSFAQLTAPSLPLPMGAGDASGSGSHGTGDLSARMGAGAGAGAGGRSHRRSNLSVCSMGGPTLAAPSLPVVVEVPHSADHERVPRVAAGVPVDQGGRLAGEPAAAAAMPPRASGSAQSSPATDDTAAAAAAAAANPSTGPLLGQESVTLTVAESADTQAAIAPMDFSAKPLGSVSRSLGAGVGRGVVMGGEGKAGEAVMLSGAAHGGGMAEGSLAAASNPYVSYIPTMPWYRRHGGLILGCLMAQGGMIAFNIGLTYGFTALGDQAGTLLPAAYLEVAGVPKSPYYSYVGGIILVLVVTFVLGFLATRAEPALRVLGRTVQHLSGGKFTCSMLIYSVAVGVGVGMAIGATKILFGVKIIYIILIKYAIACAITYFSEESFTCIAWDSAGVTTGPVTVPFVLSLGIGFSKATGATEGFGILTAASVAPIIAVLLTDMLKAPVKKAVRSLSRLSTSSMASLARRSGRVNRHDLAVFSKRAKKVKDTSQAISQVAAIAAAAARLEDETASVSFTTGGGSFGTSMGASRRTTQIELQSPRGSMPLGELPSVRSEGLFGDTPRAVVALASPAVAAEVARAAAHAAHHSASAPALAPAGSSGAAGGSGSLREVGSRTSVRWSETGLSAAGAAGGGGDAGAAAAPGPAAPGAPPA